MEKFCNNPDKKAIHIGGWLRNMYSIYDLTISPKANISKAMLIGKDVSNYIKPEGIFEKVKSHLLKNVDIVEDKNNIIIRNKYIEHMIYTLESKHKTVSIIKFVDNNSFDVLLSQNIVFVNFIDVSASNTIIECIVRNTPVIVNRHPALEEYLGKCYPGFYDDLTQAVELIQNFNNIKNIYTYLTQMDKSKLSLNYFINDFQTQVKLVLNVN